MSGGEGKVTLDKSIITIIHERKSIISFTSRKGHECQSQKAVQQVSLHQLRFKALVKCNGPRHEPSQESELVHPVVSGHIVPLQQL